MKQSAYGWIEWFTETGDIYLGRRVASTGDESFLVRGQGEGHHVARVAPEGGHLLPRLNIPQNTEVNIHYRTIVMSCYPIFVFVFAALFITN